MNKAKRKVGRPTKKTPLFLEALEKVLFNNLYSDMPAVIFTDEELLIQVNEQLLEEEMVGLSTLEKWKEDARNNTRQDENSLKFQGLYKKALLVQKSNLFKELKDENLWQKYAWILERKFKDWNIQHRTLVGEDSENRFTSWAQAVEKINLGKPIPQIKED